ncbi:MAG TPA: tetratricopeptide repeat protein [bacterium]|nr:tetratricopeptide repeat protein [bacterium]
MAKLKIKKEELKQDELRDFFDHAWHWLHVQYATRRQAVYGVAAAAALIVIGIPALLQYQEHRANKAARLLSAGKTDASMGARAEDAAQRTAALSSALAKFEELVRDYSGTAAAGEALKSMGQVNADLGQREAAVTAYRRFLSEHSGNSDEDLARYTLAGLLQDMGKYDEAAREYEQLLARSEAAYLHQYVAYQLGSLYDEHGLNQKDKAILYYQKMTPPKAGETQLWYLEARHRLAALGAPLPDDSGDTDDAA